MKKLLFATALVASAAAFADGTGPLNAISFEGYGLGDIPLPYTFANGAAELDESGTAKTPDGPYFYYQGDGDGSSVKAFGGENATAPNISSRSSYFSGDNLKYLDLSTEGGILWRGINNIVQGGTQEAPTYELGTAQAVSNGIYLDTLVQFTPTEESTPPTLEAEDKLAIWLSVNEGVTNLMVQASYYNGSVEKTATSFVVTGKVVTAGVWYRLTVKAIDNVIDESGAYGEWYKIPAFAIYIDGTEMASTTAVMDSGLANTDGVLANSFKDSIISGKVFPSLATGTAGAASTLTAVGFKGSGALDDIVWTTEDPFAGGSSGSDYVVSIDGSDVVVTPSAEDLAAVQAAVIAGGGTLDVTDVAAVNAALAAEIGSTGIPRWQALFLGLPPTEAGLESFKINSISFNEDGDIVVTLPSTVDPKTGRGVNITLKLKSADTPNAASWTDVESASGTTFAPFAPGSTDTKKFYKVVVEFAGSSAQSN